MDGFPGNDCVEPCIYEMQLLITESIPVNRDDQYGHLTWTQLLQVPINATLLGFIVSRH